MEELTDTNTVLPAFKIFNPSNVNKSSSHRNEQMEILLNHYRKDITDVLNNHSNSAQSLVSIQQQHLEQENFLEEFDDTAADLLAYVKSFAHRKLNCGEMSQEQMQLYITSNTPLSNDIYMQLVKAGALVRFPNTMKLHSLSLLILPLTSGVERAFSIMNLLVSPLWTTPSENNVDHLMRMCLDVPDKFNDKHLEQIVDNFKNSAPHRISL